MTVERQWRSGPRPQASLPDKALCLTAVLVLRYNGHSGFVLLLRAPSTLPSAGPLIFGG